VENCGEGYDEDCGFGMPLLPRLAVQLNYYYNIFIFVIVFLNIITIISTMFIIVNYL